MKWNKARLKGIVKGAIERKTREIHMLEHENIGCREEDLIKDEMEQENLLEEEDKYWRIRS